MLGIELWNVLGIEQVRFGTTGIYGMCEELSEYTVVLQGSMEARSERGSVILLYGSMERARN